MIVLLSPYPAAVASYTSVGTVTSGTGSAGTWIFEAVLTWKTGINADFSNLAMKDSGGNFVRFYIDPDAISSGVSARVLFLGAPSSVYTYGWGNALNLSDSTIFPIFHDPLAATPTMTAVTSLDGSWASTQKGMTQTVVMGPLSYLAQGYAHSTTKRFVADSTANAIVRAYSKTTNPTTALWSYSSVGHANQLTYRVDTDTLMHSVTTGTDGLNGWHTGFVPEINATTGALVRQWDFTGLGAGANYYPMYAGPGKLLLAPTNPGTTGIKFFLVSLNDTNGTFTLLNTYSMPSSTGLIQTMQGMYFDYNGAILGDAVPMVYYYVNTSGGATLIYGISFTNAAAGIRNRWGPYTWGTESEGIGWDGSTLEVGIVTASKTSYSRIDFTNAGARFFNGIPRVTSAASQWFGNTALSDAAITTGNVRVRAWSRWSAPYVYNSTANRAAVGLSTNPFTVNTWAGRISATPSTTQGTIRTSATSSTYTVSNQTVEHLHYLDLYPGVKSEWTIADVSLTPVGSYTTGAPATTSYNVLKAMIGGGAQSDTTGTNQLTGPISIYPLQAIISTITVA